MVKLVYYNEDTRKYYMIIQEGETKRSVRTSRRRANKEAEIIGIRIMKIIKNKFGE